MANLDRTHHGFYNQLRISSVRLILSYRFRGIGNNVHTGGIVTETRRTKWVCLAHSVAEEGFHHHVDSLMNMMFGTSRRSQHAGE